MACPRNEAERNRMALRRLWRREFRLDVNRRPSYIDGTVLLNGQHRLAAVLTRENVTPERARELLGLPPEQGDT